MPASRAHFYEVGIRKALFDRFRLDVSHYWRDFNHFYDDDVFLNTGVGFPISFDSARVEGTEVRLDLPSWQGITSFVSYTNMLGTATSPVTGGLFIQGGEAEELRDVATTFPISQDQRNTVTAMARFEPHARMWVSLRGRYGSGLPVELEGDDGEDARGIEEDREFEGIPPRIVDQVDIERGRIKPNFNLDFSILIDPLSVFMLFIITGVGFVIHVYSVGYMEGDPEYSRFFSYMNLFIFSMCVLVLAADFFFLIVGWALVGLASYLLIGFWRDKTSAVLAARKAFVMNVIGDVGMVIAAFVIFNQFGSLNYLDVFSAAPQAFRPNDDTVLLITVLLLVGAFAKSAQIPLHTWLPDAMEGPTPVSALIHAATMVTAGVYLIARCHVLYDLAPYTMYLVATVGVVTAIFAGSMGMVQNDIKRVIAYSTMSQLGYMFLAVGIGVYGCPEKRRYPTIDISFGTSRRLFEWCLGCGDNFLTPRNRTGRTPTGSL